MSSLGATNFLEGKTMLATTGVIFAVVIVLLGLRDIVVLDQTTKRLQFGMVDDFIVLFVCSLEFRLRQTTWRCQCLFVSYILDFAATRDLEYLLGVQKCQNVNRISYLRD